MCITCVLLWIKFSNFNFSVKIFIIIFWLAIYWFNFEISLISRFVTIYSLIYKNIKPLINILSIEITGLLIQIVRLRSISTRNIRTHLRFSDNESATQIKARLNFYFPSFVKWNAQYPFCFNYILLERLYTANSWTK